MVSSIIPNIGANTSTHTLRPEPREAGDTGVKTADDGRASAAVATSLTSPETRSKADIAAANAARGTLDRAIAALDTALAGGQLVLVALNDLRADAQKGTEAGLSSTDRADLSQNFTDKLGDLAELLQNLRAGPDSLFNIESDGVPFSPGLDPAEQLFLAPRDWQMGATGGDIALRPDAKLDTPADALAALSSILDSLTAVNDTLSAFAANAKQLDAHSGFLGKLSEGLSVTSSVADLSVESARLESLSVRQGLAGRSIAIANAAPEALLNLFRS